MSMFRATLGLTALAIAAPLAAQDYGPQPDNATKTEILRVREAAWRTWFSNDREGFQRVVPQELVGMAWSGGAWEDRATTLISMAEYAKAGERLQTLEFPRNVFQQYGDVVILYSNFRVVVVDRAGKSSETKGRGSEIFVRREGKWIHTGWHLDTVTN
jgi:hypothetical protein